ncbi:glycosyltransferase family 25 protein [Endozoicomonas sp.]|nr:glycosyltransferase family 25 protein [Endozoicomonas sp.]
MKHSSITIPAFVICLEREAERRLRIKQHLDAFGIDFSFSAAVDGRTLTPNDREQYYSEALSIKTRGRPMAAGELGCYLSHSRIWEKMVSERIPQALIIESDAVFTEEAVHVINAIEKQSLSWELLMLYYRECFPAFRDRKSLTSQSKMVRFSNKSACTTAYLITLTGAKKLLKTAYPIQMPVDDYMTGGYINKNINTFGIHPRTIHITDDALETSTIREDLFPMMEAEGIKRRVVDEKKILKEMEKSARRFVKKIFPPVWL